VMLAKRLDDPDCVKVLDFGIARLNWGEQSMATAAGLIFGTARYISPEGARGEKVSPQGDVYSIATMVYQMLAGRTPFDGDQAVALLVQQIHDPPPPLESVPRAAYVPPAIAAVVMQNLAKKAEDRAENARAFGRTLLEAAVASGLSAQDLLTRPAMLGPGRGPHTSVIQMPSMQRTDRLELEPQVAARIGAAKTSFEPPANTTLEARLLLKTEVPEPPMVSLVAPGSETTRWVPPGDFAARLLPTPPPSGVDSTMDDRDLPVSSPQASLATPAPTQAAGSTPLPVSAAVAPPEDPARSASRTASTAPPITRPPSTIDSTMAGDETPFRLPRTGGRIVAVVGVCFLVGVLGMGTVAYRAGLLGGHSRDSTDYAALAGDALANHQWESVRDLTDKGLARSPRDAQLLALRARASTEAVTSAKSRAEAGDPAAAMRLARLAAQLDPGDADASALLAALTEPPPPASVDPGIPALASGHAGGSVPPGASRAIVDVSSARPGVGQPVDLAGRIQGTSRAKVEGPTFHIAGPGIPPGTHLDAIDDGSGVFRATFTFLQGGRFEVAFTARADGAGVRATHVILVGEVKPLPGPASPSSPGPPPAPSDGTRWL
jgi:eukaryotic-like serine/threonine-protein kinase